MPTCGCPELDTMQALPGLNGAFTSRGPGFEEGRGPCEGLCRRSEFSFFFLEKRKDDERVDGGQGVEANSSRSREMLNEDPSDRCSLLDGAQVSAKIGYLSNARCAPSIGATNGTCCVAHVTERRTWLLPFRGSCSPPRPPQGAPSRNHRRGSASRSINATEEMNKQMSFAIFLFLFFAFKCITGNGKTGW